MYFHIGEKAHYSAIQFIRKVPGPIAFLRQCEARARRTLRLPNRPN